MSVQECKNEIAKTIYGHPDWATFRADGMDHRVYEDAHDMVADTFKENNDRLIEALRIIEQRDYAAMLKVVPNGIVHRSDTYNTADQFEDTGSYEEYARYTGPAQRALEAKFIQSII
jgi:hypothetical protein